MAWVTNKALSDELIKRGLVPANCRLMTVEIDPSGVPIVRYECYLKGADLIGLAEAFVAATRSNAERAGEG